MMMIRTLGRSATSTLRRRSPHLGSGFSPLGQSVSRFRAQQQQQRRSLQFQARKTPDGQFILSVKSLQTMPVESTSVPLIESETTACLGQTNIRAVIVDKNSFSEKKFHPGQALFQVQHRGPSHTVEFPSLAEVEASGFVMKELLIVDGQKLDVGTDVLLLGEEKTMTLYLTEKLVLFIVFAVGFILILGVGFFLGWLLVSLIC